MRYKVTYTVGKEIMQDDFDCDDIKIKDGFICLLKSTKDNCIFDIVAAFSDSSHVSIINMDLIKAKNKIA